MTFRIAFKALGRNKLRTGLTMLGMIIGVAAVITLVALGNGAQSAIEDQIKSAGTNMITVNAGNFTQGGVRQGSGAASTLTVEDADAIRKEIAGVQYLAPGVNSRRAGRRRQSELEHAHSGHRRRPAVDSRLGAEERLLLYRSGRAQRGEGRRARNDSQRAAVRQGRRSGRAADPDQQTTVQGHRRHGVERPGQRR